MSRLLIGILMLLLAGLPGQTSWIPAVFFELDGGQRYLHLGARATPKKS